MVLTEYDAVKEYARMMNTRNIDHFEPLIADDAPVWAEIGEIHKSGRIRPCAILSQYNQYNMVASATIEIGGDKVKRLNLFFMPSPQEAKRTGEFPV